MLSGKALGVMQNFMAYGNVDEPSQGEWHWDPLLRSCINEQRCEAT